MNTELRVSFHIRILSSTSLWFCSLSGTHCYQIFSCGFFFISIIYLSPTGGQLQKDDLVCLVHCHTWGLKHCSVCNGCSGSLNDLMNKQWHKIGTSPFHHIRKDFIFSMCKLAGDFTYSSSLRKLHWRDKRTMTPSVPHEKTKDTREGGQNSSWIWRKETFLQGLFLNLGYCVISSWHLEILKLVHRPMLQLSQFRVGMIDFRSSSWHPKTHYQAFQSLCSSSRPGMEQALCWAWLSKDTQESLASRWPCGETEISISNLIHCDSCSDRAGSGTRWKET